jgi:hypothetical protein
LERRNSFPDRINRSCHVKPGNVGCTWRRWIFALPLQSIGTSHSRSFHADQNLAGAGSWLRAFDRLEDFGAAGGTNFDCEHSGTSTKFYVTAIITGASALAMSSGRIASTFILSVLISPLAAWSQDSSTPTQTPTPVPAPQNVTAQKQPPPQEPKILEDGGFSIEPIYWFTRAQPTLRGGASAGTFEGQSYTGHSNASLGGELSIPAGDSNTLRFSYFRVQGNSSLIQPQNVTLFGEAYSAGDYVASSYTLQSAKISWDYLSYTWRREPGNIHFKTLYELQFANIGTQFVAPYKAVTTDSGGNTDYNSANGSKHIFLPTIGGELEQAIGKNVRWEVKGSGFGIPHHGVIWDAQADVAIRVHKLELIAGERAFYFKTSPKAEQYFSDTLNGVFAGIRYYLTSSK